MTVHGSSKYPSQQHQQQALGPPVDRQLRPTGTTLITKRFAFESAHFLPQVPPDHKCKRTHGHSYQVWVHVTGDVDACRGWIVDFGDIKTVWKELEDQLDHRVLNDIQGLENPTAENLAAWIWHQFDSAREKGRANFRVVAVEVAETTDSRALFVPPGWLPWVSGLPVASSGGNGATIRQQASSAGVANSPESSSPLVHDGVTTDLEDVQARADHRGIALDEVGVSNVRIPLEVYDRNRGSQATVASVNMSVDLSAEIKGTHLSRLIQALRDRPDAVTPISLGDLTRDLRSRLGATRARVRVEFPYFTERAAPVSGEVGDLDVDCAFETVDRAGTSEQWLEVTTPVMTVCPCSRDISDYGAHNQRGHVTVRIRCAHDDVGLPSLVWIEELIELADSASSFPVYPVVKRPDERHITMSAYNRPQFVEDVARDVVKGLKDDSRICDYDVYVKNEESIHSHDAFARVRPDPRN